MAATADSTVLTAVTTITESSGRTVPELLEDLDPIDPGHQEVEQHDVDMVGVERGERGVAVLGEEDVMVVLQDQSERFTDGGIVVHDKHDGARATVRTCDRARPYAH